MLQILNLRVNAWAWPMAAKSVASWRSCSFSSGGLRGSEFDSTSITFSTRGNKDEFLSEAGEGCAHFLPKLDLRSKAGDMQNSIYLVLRLDAIVPSVWLSDVEF